MDARTEGLDSRERTRKDTRGRKDTNKEDGAVIKLEPLKKSLRELGTLATKAAAANEQLKDAVKKVAEKSGLLASVVRRLVKAHSGDSDQFNDEKRKAEQMQLVLDEIPFEGEITKAAKGDAQE